MSNQRAGYQKKLLTNNKIEVRTTIGYDSNSKQVKKQKTFAAKTPKAEIDKWVMEQKVNFDKGTIAKPKVLTVQDLFSEWTNAVKTNWTPTTLKGNERMLRKHVTPFIGKIQLQSLKANQITPVFTKMAEKGLSDRSIQLAYTLVNQAMSYALDMEYIVKSPTKPIKKYLAKGKVVNKEKVLRPDEVKRFLEASKDNKWHTLFCLLLTTGLRIGEALSLEWKAFDGKTVKVEQSLENITSGFKVKLTPKTEYSKREVPLAPQLVAMLNSLERKGKYIFSGEGINYYKSISKELKKILTKEKLPSITLHGLRHTACTLFLHNNMNPKTISAIMGHFEVGFTLDTYTKVLPEMLDEVPEKVGSIFFPMTQANNSDTFQTPTT
jgi:integrase